MNSKITSVLHSMELIRGEYRFKKARYQDAKLKLDELRVYKDKVKN